MAIRVRNWYGIKSATGSMLTDSILTKASCYLLEPKFIRGNRSMNDDEPLIGFEAVSDGNTDATSTVQCEVKAMNEKHKTRLNIFRRKKTQDGNHKLPHFFDRKMELVVE